MATITLTVEQSGVYDEVARTTDYTGSKMEESDANLRDRILSTDDDLSDMGRFWEETAAVADERLKAMYTGGSAPNESTYTARLEVSAAFDRALLPAVEAALRSYFVKSIVGKWYRYCNKGETKDYLAEAQEMMDDALRKLYSRKRPLPPRKNRQ